MTYQNGTQYEIHLARDTGERIALLDNVGPFSYTLALNYVGSFSLTLPEGFDRTLVARDRRVFIWRKPVGGAMRLAFAGLIRRTRAAAPRGSVSRIVQGTDLNDLLRRRIVAYAAASAQAQMTAAADNMMKEIVRDNMGTDATAARQLSATYFSVAANASLGPSLTKGFAYRNVLDVLRDLSDAARKAGTDVYFGIVPTGETTFEFRTRTGEWGRDRTADSGNPLIFGLEYENLEGPELSEDALEEVNFAYGLGHGEESFRDVQTSEDTTRSGASLFARAEASINASGEATSAAVLDMADGRVVKGRPASALSARLLSAPGAVYGVDWGHGDRVGLTFDGRQCDAIVRSVTVSVDEAGRETIDTTAEAIL